MKAESKTKNLAKSTPRPQYRGAAPSSTPALESPSLWNLEKLKERGWTAALVKRFLGDPDGFKANPYYRNAAPQKLYLSSRVQAIEQTELFRDHRTKSAIRREGALARAEVAREELQGRALAQVKVRAITWEKLRLSALAHVRRRNDERGHYGEPDPSMAPEEVVHRWMVNYARHELSNYDRVRIKFFGKVGVHAAAEAVRDVVLDKIAETWPALKQACERARRSMEPD